MNSITGTKAPLHRRFNKSKSIQYIRNRYKNVRERIAPQVEALQGSKPFRELCQTYYAKGYKDWMILVVILNAMMNWKAKENGLDLRKPDEFLKIQHQLKKVIYPVERFTKKEMDFHIDSHFLTTLKTYGFDFRRRQFKPEVVEKFLRERMNHFEFDLQHNLMFGEPPGDWPLL